MTMVRLLKTRLFWISLSLAIVSSTAQHLPRDGKDASQADKRGLLNYIIQTYFIFNTLLDFRNRYIEMRVRS